MPILFNILKFLFLAAAQTAAFEAGRRALDTGLNFIRDQVMRSQGMNAEEAENSVAIQIISVLSGLGAVAALIKSRLPLRWSDKIFKLSAAPKTVTAPIKTPPKGAVDSSLGGTLGKGIIGVTGGLLVWNLLTDWVWIGSSLGFLPEETQNDIQKRALTIQQLINSPKSLVYSAEKARRQLSQQERELIKTTADEAEREIKELQQVYLQKFSLYGKSDVMRQLNASALALTLELSILRQMAGLIPRQPVQKVSIEALVTVVFDGDTIKLDNGETVRLVGIDAPESTTPAGERSKKYLHDRLLNKRVRVESDANALIDIYGRRLGVVYLLKQ